MSVTITIPAERLAGWHRRWAERITPGLLAKAAAGALQTLIVRHLARVSETRHATANRPPPTASAPLPPASGRMSRRPSASTPTPTTPRSP